MSEPCHLHFISACTVYAVDLLHRDTVFRLTSFAFLGGSACHDLKILFIMELLVMVKLRQLFIFILLFLIGSIAHRRIKIQKQQTDDKYNNNDDYKYQQHFAAYF